MKNTIEIITVGNEILIGHTLDTNSNWIARQATKHGWIVQRVTQLRDSLPAISGGLRESLQRSPTIIITIGGLGPTHDDITLKGTARALGKRSVINRTALQFVKDHYKAIEGSPSITRHRRKMATLPEGAEPVQNPVGTAPGVVTKAGRTIIFSLPGVPSEMKAIFLQSVVPRLKTSRAERPSEAYLTLAGIVESALAPVLSLAQQKFPGLYFKSHPRGTETGIRSLIRLHIYTIAPESSAQIPRAAAYIVASLSNLP